jgi:hypothetical protein
MKALTVFTLLLLSLGSLAQRQKPVSIRMTGQYTVTVEGIGLNTAGLGIGAAGSFFARKRLQLLTEAYMDRYVGDKVLVLDQQGRPLPDACLLTVHAGPQVFFSRSLALAATYGAAWHRYRERSFTLDHAVRTSITGYFGSSDHFILQAYWTLVPRAYTRGMDIQQVGVGAGYRLL